MSLLASSNAFFFKRLVLWPLITLVVLIVGSLILYQVFIVNTYQQAQQVVQQEQALQKAQLQVKQLNDQRELLLRYQADFADVQATGLFEPLNRVQWTDQLTAWSQDWLASGLSIQFSGVQKINPSDVKYLPITQSIFSVNRVQVGLRLQIDSDFDHFMLMLRQQIDAPILLERCDLTLQRSSLDFEAVLNSAQGNINMQCSFLQLYAEPRSFNSAEWR